MRRFRKWVVTLGILGAAPGMAMAGLPKLHVPNFAGSRPTVVSQDAGAAERISKALKAGHFKGADIHVQFENGTAVLTGTVQSELQKMQVEALTKAVSDVKRVVNKLTVAEPQRPRLLPVRTGQEVSRGAAPSQIRTVSHETAEPAASSSEKPRTLPHLASLFHAKPAVKRSSSPLKRLFTKLAPTSRVSGQRRNSVNQKVAESIAAALRRSKLSGYDMEVSFKDGVATIRGKIDTEEEKARVSQIVAQVPAVKAVRNELTVQSQPKGLGNQELAERVAKALKEAKIIGTGIDIEVRDGVVKLTGSVADSLQKAKAAEVVAAIPGVKMVDNQLTAPQVAVKSSRTGVRQVASEQPEPKKAAPSKQVRSPSLTAKRPVQGGPRPLARSASTNQEVAERIASALKQARLAGYDIQIAVKDGVATLRGQVASPQAAHKAAEIASRVPGVRVVENELTAAQPVASPRPAVPAVRPERLAVAPLALPAGAAVTAAHQVAVSVPALGGQPVATQAAVPAGPPSYGHPGSGASHVVYNMPNLPEMAWPAYAAYPNYAQVTYPTQYSASAWPYIGPFYPYPQIPLGWRQVQLEWDDGYWNLNFRPRTNKWWWFLNPENWTK